jgi:predicted alpha/beta-fold hydrolase
MTYMYLLGIFTIFITIFRYKRQQNNLLLIHSNSKLAKFFKMITDTFLENYGPSIFLSSGHLQTFLLEIFNMLARSTKQYFNIFKFSYEKELFRLNDGGTMLIAKAIKSNDKNEKNIYNNSTHKKILLIIPGYTADYEEFYVKNFVDDFVDEFDCRIINMRGIGKIKLTTPQMISTFSYKDVFEMILSVCESNPESSVFGVGFSFGGMLLARCLGSYPDTIPKNFIAGCGICYPVCLEKTANFANNRFRGLYPRFVSKNLKRMFLENLDIIFDEKFECNKSIIEDKENVINEIKNLKLCSEFDKKFTFKILGFKSADEYLQDAKMDKFLEKIEIPFLSIFTLDDPVLPYDAIPLELMKKNKNLITMISKKGGHLAFFSGIIPERWIKIPIKTFFKSLEIIFETEDKKDHFSDCILLEENFFNKK